MQIFPRTKSRIRQGPTLLQTRLYNSIVSNLNNNFGFGPKLILNWQELSSRYWMWKTSKFNLWNTFQSKYSQYLTQNVVFHIKSHVTKHEFWGLLILKSQHLMLQNLTWNETWNDTSLNKSGDCAVM